MFAIKPATIMAYASSPPQHPATRLAAPTPGAGPKLRAPGTQYRRTGFVRPANSKVAGAATLPHRVLRSAVPMPPNFSWLPCDLVPVVDQGNCGSCWAQSIAEVVADRACAISGGKVRVPLSVRMVQECCSYMAEVTAGGCDGNDTYSSLKSLVTKGAKLPAASAYPRKYDANTQQVDTAACVLDGGGPTAFSVSVKDAWLVSENIGTAGDEANKRNVENMKQHIYNEGPVIATFAVYQDFYDYDGQTIYEPSTHWSNTNVGYHAVEMVGWGTDATSGTQYWICKNSWGADWPSAHKPCAGQGWFYIKAGMNVCEIESYTAGAAVVINNASAAVNGDDNYYPIERATCPTTTTGGGVVVPSDNTTDGGGGTLPSPTQQNTRRMLIIAGVAALGVGLAVAAYYYLYMRRVARPTRKFYDYDEMESGEEEEETPEEEYAEEPESDEFAEYESYQGERESR